MSRIAEELGARLEPLLRGRTTAEKDVIIFEESRRILIAEIQVWTISLIAKNCTFLNVFVKKHTLQNIVYSEYLPVVLGRSTMELLGIDLDTGSTYNQVCYYLFSPII